VACVYLTYYYFVRLGEVKQTSLTEHFMDGAWKSRYRSKVLNKMSANKNLPVAYDSVVAYSNELIPFTGA
jgi:hypothetical protein